MPKVSAFASGYIDCAVWLAPEEDNISGDDLSPDVLNTLASQADEFASSFRDLLDIANNEGRNDEYLGHDFFLTRNGHGAGFWDRGLSVGEELSNMARPYGECGIYRGDNGEVFV